MCLGDRHLGTAFKFAERKLLTCQHVIQSVADTDALYVTQNGKVHRAKVIFRDGRYDVGVLLIEDDVPPGNLVLSSRYIERGLHVWGVGYVGGNDGRRCSALLQVGKGVLGTQPQGPLDTIYNQFTASIVADNGMSGGPVLDRCGHLVGMIQGARGQGIKYPRYSPWFILQDSLRTAGLSLSA